MQNMALVMKKRLCMCSFSFYLRDFQVIVFVSFFVFLVFFCLLEIIVQKNTRSSI